MAGLWGVSNLPFSRVANGEAVAVANGDVAVGEDVRIFDIVVEHEGLDGETRLRGGPTLDQRHEFFLLKI